MEPQIRLIDRTPWQPGKFVSAFSVYTPFHEAEWSAMRQADMLILKTGLSAAIEPNRYKK